MWYIITFVVGVSVGFVMCGLLSASSHPATDALDDASFIAEQERKAAQNGISRRRDVH